MPKKAKELKPKQVEALRSPGFHAVGGVSGLYLRVYESGARCWVLRYATPEIRYSRTGKPFAARRDLGLGGYPDVTLGQAREKARAFKEQIAQGIDPAAERAEARQRWAEQVRRGITFEQAARQAYHPKGKKGAELAEGSRKRAVSRLEHHAFPIIGHIPVEQITVAHCKEVLDPIWLEKTETATRVRQIMEGVLSWAKVSGYRDGDNPAAWQDNLKDVLPNPSRISRVQHYPALPWHRAPAFLEALRQREGPSARALEFVILTGARSGEVRGATWGEIDIPGRVWTIPGERMKGGLTHKVPLSEDAARLLEAMPRMAGSEQVFPSQKGTAMSDMALTSLIRRMHNAGGEWTDPATGRVATAHGFRSTFKDWARNRTSFADEVSELQLAHVNNDATRAAYARDELLPQRARLVEEWARFLREGEPESATVTAIGQGAGHA